MTTILQISDTHILPEGPLVSNVLDTASSLEKLIIRINQLRVKHNDIECILVSGDISEDGSSDSYQRFKSIMSLLELPIYVIPGNHDARENMREAFIAENIFTKTGPLNWHKKIGHINLIGLDTLVEGQGGGYLMPESLEYLEKTLNNIKSEPTMLALHHPPFETGIQFMDSIGLKNTNEFKTIISNFNGELRVVCGHIHCMMVANLNNHIAISSPSPSSSFEYDTRSSAPVGFMNEVDGCLLHKWNNGFKTVRVGPLVGSGPFPF